MDFLSTSISVLAMAVLSRRTFSKVGFYLEKTWLCHDDHQQKSKEYKGLWAFEI
jgi:hypothetical protein